MLTKNKLGFISMKVVFNVMDGFDKIFYPWSFLVFMAGMGTVI